MAKRHWALERKKHSPTLSGCLADQVHSHNPQQVRAADFAGAGISLIFDTPRHERRFKFLFTISPSGRMTLTLLTLMQMIAGRNFTPNRKTLAASKSISRTLLQCPHAHIFGMADLLTRNRGQPIVIVSIASSKMWGT